MKIYFDGCSYTRGSPKWGVDDWKERRWSKLLSNKLDAEECNFARSGGSNPRILRNITTTHDISDYDLAVILMTRPARTEYYYDGKFRHVYQKNHYNFHEDGLKFWNFYYKNIYDEQYGSAYEEVIQKSIKAICEVNKVPLVLMSNWYKTKLSFDMMVHSGIYEQTSPTDKHPSLDAQSKIADDIYKIINNS